MRCAADLHTHTVLSGHAFSTVAENARAAAEAGLAIIANTDHGPAMPGAASAPYHFANQRTLPETICGVRVLAGAEANIVDDAGTLDVPARILSRLDLVLAGLHDVCIVPGDARTNTDRLLGAMASGLVDVIAHPGNPVYPVFFEELIEGALRHGVLLEINASSLKERVRPGSRSNLMRLLAAARGTELCFTLGSDAHWQGEVGGFDAALAFLDEQGIEPSRILNLDAGRVHAFVAHRREIRRDCHEG